jgi:hypothetical protein
MKWGTPTSQKPQSNAEEKDLEEKLMYHSKRAHQTAHKAKSENMNLCVNPKGHTQQHTKQKLMIFDY